jgi:hypothetical protein
VLAANDAVLPFVIRSNLPMEKPTLLMQSVGIPGPIQLYLEPGSAVSA